MAFEDILIILLVCAAVWYIAVQIGLFLGLQRAALGKRNASRPFVTVIVAARNEEKTIGALLNCLAAQTYSNKEIIIVNDRSDDRTEEIIESYHERLPQLTCLKIEKIPNDWPAKKFALNTAIQAAHGEILCFTDADCFPRPRWIETLVERFDETTGLVAGYSPYRLPPPPADLLHQFITYEEFRAAIWTAGSIGWNLGWLCTGRNLAYRKSVFEQVGGYEKIRQSISGDDDLFLQVVQKETSWNIRYVFSSQNFVPTLPPETFDQFVNQRKRHFSAAKFFDWKKKLFFGAYHAANTLLLLSILFAPFLSSTFMVLFLVVLKFLADFMLLGTYFVPLRAERFTRSFVLMEVLYAAYNASIGLLGIFGTFQWKPEQKKVEPL